MTAEYQIMTDATADLTAELAAEQGLTVIPMSVDMGEQSYSFGPKGGNISTAEFYDRLVKGEVARTSQINAVVYRQYFEEELKQGRDVIYIGLSSGLSGSVGVAMVTAQELQEKYPGRQVICVDSLCAAAGEGLLAYTAVQKKKQGLTVEQLGLWLEENKRNMAHWVTVDELSYLQRGGRVSAAAAAFGTMLNIKPIIHVNGEGKLISVNKVRGRKKSLEFLAAALKDNRNDDPAGPVFIGYGTALEDASYLREIIMAGDGPQDVRFMPIGPVIGAHTGPSVIALFFFGDTK
jgi:DegV family protein with EDD domain